MGTGNKDRHRCQKCQQGAQGHVLDPFLLLQDDQQDIQGYILCAESYASFKEYIQEYFEEIKKVAPSFVFRCDISEYEAYQKEYPAHLHVDILEDCCGKGSGTLLMHTLLDALKKEQVPGIMVGVAKNNQRAFNFYQKMGFKILVEAEYGYALGQKL